MRLTAANLPLIRRSWLYQDFGNREFEMQRPKPLVTPFPELRYASSCMRSTTLIDLDLTVTIPLELKGVEGHSVLITHRCFVYRDFATCEDEGSCPLVSRMPKRRPTATCPSDGWLRILWDFQDFDESSLPCMHQVKPHVPFLDPTAIDPLRSI
jgi:hypothetical protein